MNCIDLKEMFGDKYRIGRDQSEGPLSRDPWMMTIRCKTGHIYPHGGEMLGVSVNDNHRILCGQLRRMECVERHPTAQGRARSVITSTYTP